MYNNGNNFFGILQTGLRTVVGATTDAIETLQDTQKRNQAFTEFNEQWQKKSQEWVEKGEVTESQARQVIEQLIKNKGVGNSSTPQEITIESDDVSDPYEGIKELTEEIIALRAEIEKLNSDK